MKKGFEKIDTVAIKGIAIILMFMHHLWTFDDRISGGALKSIFKIFGDTSIHHIGRFGKICVSLFFFLGGYGIYISSKNKNFNILNKIKKLYVSYWKVFLIFIPLGFLAFNNIFPYCQNNSIYLRFSSFDWKTTISDFLGISSNLNGEWWFFKSYLFALITFPFLKKVMENKDLKSNLFIIIILTIMTTKVFPSIGKIEALGNLNSSYLYYNLFCQGAPFIASFWMGILFAKENLIIRVKDLINKEIKLNIIIDAIILLFIVYLRQIGISDNLDIIYVPIFVIICNDLLNRVKILNKLFCCIGKESTNMWLIHSFYCYYFYPIVKIVVSPRWAVLSLIILIILSYISSIVLDYFWKVIICIINKLKIFGERIVKREKIKA